MESAEITRTLTSSIFLSAAHDRASFVSVVAAGPCSCALAGGGRKTKTAAMVVPLIRQTQGFLHTAYLSASIFLRRFALCVHSCRPKKRSDPRQTLLQAQVSVLPKCIILRIKTVTGKQTRSFGA